MDSTTNIAGTGERRIGRSLKARLARIREASDGAKLISEALGKASEITKANALMVAQAAFEEFMKDPGERDEKLLAQYMTIALRSRDLELKESAHQLAREKHYYNLAKKSLEFVEQLKDINDGEDDEREKIEKAMVLLFGERPDITDFRDAEFQKEGDA